MYVTEVSNGAAASERCWRAITESVWEARNCGLFFLARARASSSVRRSTGGAGVVGCWTLLAGKVLVGAGDSCAPALLTRGTSRAVTEAHDRMRVRSAFINLDS